VGIVEKDRVITGGTIKPGDSIIGLQSGVFRSNGMSLVRQVLEDKFRENWVNEPYEDETTQPNDVTSWGEVVLTPSIIYSAFCCPGYFYF